MKNTSSNVGSGVYGRYSVVFSVSLVIIVLGFVYFYNLGGWLINDDEGSFLYLAWRVSVGERPYQDMLTTHWPLFLYTAGGWMRIVGMNVVLMRALTVSLTLGTALLVFGIARLYVSPEAALFSMVVFLLHPEIFHNNRFFQPEPFYLFFGVLGLYFFARGYETDRKLWLLGAGISFAISSLYKILALQIVAGVGLFIIVDLLRNLKAWRSMIVRPIVLFLSYAVPYVGVVASFILFVPHFYDSVTNLHLAQGQELALSQVIANGLIFLLRYSLTFAPFLLLVLPSAWAGWRGDRKTALFSWQLLTAFAFVILSRDLFVRHLLYLVPSMAILFASTLEPIRHLGRRLLFLAVVCAIIIPWLTTDAQHLLRSEQETMAIAEYIDDHIPPEAYVISDYQEMNFYARRPSTYSGSEISLVILAGGQVTGEQFIAEIEEKNVQMVILDVSPVTPSHLVALWDYDEFRAYLDEHFVSLGVFPRDQQRLEIYYRPVDSGE